MGVIVSEIHHEVNRESHPLGHHLRLNYCVMYSLILLCHVFPNSIVSCIP